LDSLITWIVYPSPRTSFSFYIVKKYNTLKQVQKLLINNLTLDISRKESLLPSDQLSTIESNDFSALFSSPDLMLLCYSSRIKAKITVKIYKLVLFTCLYFPPWTGILIGGNSKTGSHCCHLSIASCQGIPYPCKVYSTSALL
jgi:hypothetical protein